MEQEMKEKMVFTVNQAMTVDKENNEDGTCAVQNTNNKK